MGERRRPGPAEVALFGTDEAPLPAIMPPREPGLPMCKVCKANKMRRVNGRGREDHTGKFMMCEKSMEEWSPESFAGPAAFRLHKRPDILPLPREFRAFLPREPKAKAKGKGKKDEAQLDLLAEQERKQRLYHTGGG